MHCLSKLNTTIASLTTPPLVAQQHEVGSVFHKERFTVKCDDAVIAGVVYLAAHAASVRSLVLPVAVHDSNAIPSPLLDVYIHMYMHAVHYAIMYVYIYLY